MTDKEIIIDGVDVSECEFYFDEKCRCMDAFIMQDFHSCPQCNSNPNCHYKQLKCKEQECEKLYIQLKADEEYHKEEENTLRKIIKNKEERNIELYKENNKLKQTLTEIKEIAKIEYPKSLFTETFVEVIKHCPYFDCGNCKCLENKEKQNCGGFICSRKQSVYYQENTIYFKQILQKISEVENGR